MYQIFVDFKIGDYLKDKAGNIYELTKLSVNVEFNIEAKKDKPHILLQGLNAREPWGRSFILQYHQVVKATKEEVDNYILSNNTPNHVKNFDINKALSTKPPKKANEIKVRTLDEVLDETIRYEYLIEVLGDDDGSYERKISSLKDEFIFLSAGISWDKN